MSIYGLAMNLKLLRDCLYTRTRWPTMSILFIVLRHRCKLIQFKASILNEEIMCTLPNGFQTSCIQKSRGITASMRTKDILVCKPYENCNLIKHLQWRICICWRIAHSFLTIPGKKHKSEFDALNMHIPILCLESLGICRYYFQIYIYIYTYTKCTHFQIGLCMHQVVPE